MKNDSSYNLRKIFEQMEFDLVASMSRNLKRHEEEEKKEGFKWEQWQSAKLRNLRLYRKENQQIINKYSDKVNDTVEKSLSDSYKTGQGFFSKLLDKIKGLFKGSISFPDDLSQEEQGGNLSELIRPQEDNFFHMNDKKIVALQDTVKNDLDKAQKSILRKMDDVYRKTVYKAEVNITSGAKSLDQAIDMATKDFLNQGINCIQYKNGRLVNIASYAEMALRTANHRATLLGEGKKRDEWGIYTVVVSAHANTCPLCEPWQGKILIDDVFTGITAEKAQELSQEKGYPLVSTAIKAGLLHPNCRHSLSTYFPGITQIPTIPDGEEAINKYKAEQHQRLLERKIRKYKRVAEGSLDKDNKAKVNDKAKEYQAKLREHLNKHPYLRRDYSREKTRDLPDKPKNYVPYGTNIKED